MQAEYVCDTNVLINLEKAFGPKRLSRAFKQGRIIIPEGVERELRRRSDPLTRLVSRLPCENILRIGSRPGLPDELVRVERTYGKTIEFGKKRYEGFWKGHTGSTGADGSVVAVAKVLKLEAASDDKAVQMACALEGVRCITSAELALQLRFVRPQQALPFEGDAASRGR